MRFKLLKLVLSLSCFVLQLDLEAVDRKIGDRGEVQALSSASIAAADIRNDGRYLFYAPSDSSSVYALDLLDFATTGLVHTVSGYVKGIRVFDNRYLVIAHTNGVAYVDAEYPFRSDKVTFSDPYDRSSSVSTGSVFGACVDKDRHVFLLESDADPTNRLVRVIDRNLQTAALSWTTLFPSTTVSHLSPRGIRCSQDHVVVAASDTTDDRAYYISVFPAGSPNSSGVRMADIGQSFGVDYRLADLIVSRTDERLMALFNNSNPGSADLSDAQIISIPLESNPLSISGPINMGQGGRGLANFFNGSTLNYGVFLESAVHSGATGDPTSDVFGYFGALEIASDLANHYRRGDASVSTTSRLSEWFSTSGSSYALGLRSDSGIRLLSQAPKLQFSGSFADQRVNATTPLTFSLVSDEDVDLTYRIDEDISTDGALTGIPEALSSVGRAVDLSQDSWKSLTADVVNENIQVSLAELGVTKNQAHALVILAKSRNQSADAPWARLGLRFTYDPPPGVIRNFHLRFGDQGAYVYFDPPTDDDIQTYRIHFSYSASDLTTLVDTPRSVTGVVGTLTSPVNLDAAAWKGRYAIGPIQNGSELFVRVQVIDKTGQVSSGDPAALGITPYATKTLQDALGSTRSCALGSAPMSLDQFLMSLWAMIAALALAFYYRKSISRG